MRRNGREEKLLWRVRGANGGARLPLQQQQPAISTEMNIPSIQRQRAPLICPPIPEHAARRDPAVIRAPFQISWLKAGEARGDCVEILEGVKPGEEVVSQGAFKLRNGVPIAVNNSVKVEAELAPRPENR